MRLRTLGIAAVATAAMSQPSDAVVRPKAAEAPLVAANQAPRTQRTTRYTDQVAGFAGWTAIWDHDTDVPLRLWGPGILTSGSVANAAIAEAAARQFLAAHLATLAPGASIGDFELASNALSRNGDIRSVGFSQRANGVRVLGGAVGFSFKADRLAMVSSTALPHVSVAVPAARLASTTVAARATSWLASAGHAVTAKLAAVAPSDRVIVPIVRPRVGARPSIAYRVAEQVAVEAIDGPGRWIVWVDAGDGAPIARQSQIHYASGTVLFNVPDRYPAGGRSGKPAATVTHTVNGTPTLSTVNGAVTWAGTASATVEPGLVGSLVAITNKAGPLVTDSLTLAPNGSVTWSKATTEKADSQLSAYVYANQAKRFAKERINPNLAYLDRVLSVTVNEPMTCNAYSTGDDIHFFNKALFCENTGRLADVVYHEFGHSLHFNSLIPGVGQFDGAMSEGLADTLAAFMTNDNGMGRGFFFNNTPLRDLNPAVDKKFPGDANGEVHNDGEIVGGTMWDVWKMYEAKLGQAAGFEKGLDIYYGVMQRATDMQSAFAEALLTDDDDGNIANGTPNYCDLAAQFARHGLANPMITSGVTKPTRDGYAIQFSVTGGQAACPGPTVQSAVVDWNLRGQPAAKVSLTANGTTYAGMIPTQPDGSVVQYKLTITMSDGGTLTFPTNKAEPYYEFYVGEVTKLWCADFEAGLGEWTHGATPPTGDEWEVGAPLGLAGDPKAAYGGNNVLGIDLSKDGAYSPAPMDMKLQSFAESPEIDLAGNTKVRLQLQRWLGTEDGFYDKARILVNGTELWKNFTSATDPMGAGKQHLDQEWQFRDFDLSAQAATGKVKLRFELESDPGLEFGGWTLDDVCIVALTGAAATCGNGSVDTGETCDDGNRVDGDGCNANCQDETGGGGGDDDDTGCCSVGGSPEGALALSALTLGLVLRRRRRA